MDIQDAIEFLRNKDEVLNKIIEKVGYCTLSRRDDYFKSLVASIINQQLSGSAADSIFSNFLKELRGKLEPERVLNLSDSQFRKVGISRAKEKYIRGLSKKFRDDNNFLAEIDELSDEDVVNRLTELNGVGRWTAEMFLMFSLNRIDVLPIGDSGFRRAVSKFYLNGKKAEDYEIINISRKWEPYKTIAVWYLWRGLDSKSLGPIQNHLA